MTIIVQAKLCLIYFLKKVEKALSKKELLDFKANDQTVQQSKNELPFGIPFMDNMLKDKIVLRQNYTARLFFSKKNNKNFPKILEDLV